MLSSSKNLKTRIPYREKWTPNSIFRNYAISVFIDESNRCPDSGIFSDNLIISASLRLPKQSFQPEIYEINVGAKKITPFFLSTSIGFYIDSFAEIKSSNSNINKSKYLYDYIQS